MKKTSYLKKQVSELCSKISSLARVSHYSAHIIPNFPGKKFVFPWDVVFLPSLDFDAVSIVVYRT